MNQWHCGRNGRGRGRDFASRAAPKKKVSNHIPERWKDYLPVGQRMPGTRFIAFKVPLQKKYEAKLMPEECFSPLDLFNKIQEQNEELGLIIDLTYTQRYYKAEDLPETISYIKILTVGHQVPNSNTIFKFKSAVKEFLKKNKDNDKLIGVHCTHGLNRTGYLICRKFSQNKSVYQRGLIPPPGPAGEDYSQRKFFWNLKPNGSQATQNKKWTSGSYQRPFYPAYWGWTQ
ncbi:RNA/RNP complex-1-interacting phosphatase [Cricetulus griseus]|uniref:RNA/RNP complex-1-interacting phosphatase n=1 Tax=Cricetulus griseus TaxID=10029 RepID=G3I498_CRIGR|nr:RNA/RNP complex-1-interacting phosphatase [Cricetulus griseus]